MLSDIGDPEPIRLVGPEPAPDQVIRRGGLGITPVVQCRRRRYTPQIPAWRISRSTRCAGIPPPPRRHQAPHATCPENRGKVTREAPIRREEPRRMTLGRLAQESSGQRQQNHEDQRSGGSVGGQVRTFGFGRQITFSAPRRLHPGRSWGLEDLRQEMPRRRPGSPCRPGCKQ